MSYKCTQSINLWVADEELRLKKKPGQSSFYNALLGLTNNVLGEYASSSYEGFNLLDSIRKDVASGISSAQGGANIAASVLTGQQNSINTLSGNIDFIRDLASNIEAVGAAQPKYVSDKSIFSDMIDQLQNQKAKFGVNPAAPDGPPDQLQQLVNSGFIDQESIDSFSASHSIFNSTSDGGKIQVVNEIRDRYYTIDPINYSNISNNFNENSLITIVDESGQTITEVYSSGGTGSIAIDGTITIPTSDGDNLSFSLKINNQPPSNAGARKPSLFNERNDILSNIDGLKEEFKYEIWVCILLDMIETLISKVDAIGDIISLMINAQSNLTNLENLTSKLVHAPPPSLMLLDNVQKALNDLISNPLDLTTDILGLSNVLSANGFLGDTAYAGGITVCDLNKTKYCSISNNIKTFLESITPDLDFLNQKFESFNVINDLLNDLDLSGLTNMFQSLLDEIQSIQKDIKKLKSEFCYIIHNKIVGIPKTLSKVLNAISILSLAVISLPSLDIDSLDIFPDANLFVLVSRLEKAGYTMGAHYLLTGDFLNFFLFDPAAGNHASQVSDCLNEYSDKTRSQRRSIAMQNLSRTSSARGAQAINSQRIRESSQRRFNGSSNTALAIKNKATPLILEIENEQ
jgi:hypothetical protein